MENADSSGMASIEERADRIIAVNPALAREIARRFQIEPSGLTKRQSEALAFLRDFQATHGVAPTYSEAAQALGVSKTAAFQMIHRLEKRGHIRMLSNQCRSMAFTEAA
ncbi:DNA-binding MarR family transcriptional regulator [Phyllobacterium sp. 1468]|uniref:LexA family protein n=1 Tax=Phyllobacterium sp. 1468 TaxID=2817759 RepID=UPI00285BC28A|nr:LysR family transcriptional regulator [Phyllobacterium sp. 1468]MDR6632365.1 DNA-binding MarR family transcriptional regulator [Phyllobacterium sp. 1468]